LTLNKNLLSPFLQTSKKFLIFLSKNLSPTFPHYLNIIKNVVNKEGGERKDGRQTDERRLPL
jgi:hypothetical protein